MGSDEATLKTEILVIGSGAGGAVTAATLAEAGRTVLVVEEGPAFDTETLVTNSPQAMQTLYRNAGLSPILGTQSIAFVEGCCVGGSTEINSAFWHRPPPGAVQRWKALYDVRDLADEDLKKICHEIETTLGVSMSKLGSHRPSSRVFKNGLESVGAPALETPRMQRGDLSASQFAPGAKCSMARSYLPRAKQAGATILPGCRATRLHYRDDGYVTGVSVAQDDHNGHRTLSIEAEAVFVCGGAIQTPALLRFSGIKRNIGDSLRIQPMLKIAAQFEERLDSHLSVMPVYQLRDPFTGIFLGGSVFTPGFLAMALSDRWPENEAALKDWRYMAIYYTACGGTGQGSVRAFPWTGESVARYVFSPVDGYNLRIGLVRLCEVLFAGGARRLFPGLRRCPPLESLREAVDALDRPIPMSDMNLSTVHISSSCPMGENEERCAVDSFGRVHKFYNLYVADASIIPEAPGVNPQGTVMTLALRNARHFLNHTKGSDTH
ncbi:MAG TPA: GMC family oxidoreductase [Candidatus Margulisiibacteriota bacterium]|nr:GMC family oxidoreductase [Candidatus Margulisiibacteriota bacterium]